MDEWKKDARRDVVMVDIDTLVPADHLLRKIEKVMDYDWLYERLNPYYCHDNGRPGADPVVLIKMVLIQHLYGIPSLRQTFDCPYTNGFTEGCNNKTKVLKRVCFGVRNFSRFRSRILHCST